MYTIKLCQKQLWRNLASVTLKLKKLYYLFRFSIKSFSISIFNAEGCLAYCLIFRPFLPFDPYQLGWFDPYWIVTTHHFSIFLHPESMHRNLFARVSKITYYNGFIRYLELLAISNFWLGLLIVEVSGALMYKV